MSSNKKIGSDFEKEVAEQLNKAGYWVMVIPDDKQGQPFDVIAVKNNIAYVIECKTCKNGKFNTNRIEVNQRYALDFFKKAGNENSIFAFKYGDKIYLGGAENILKEEGTIDITNLIPLESVTK